MDQSRRFIAPGQNRLLSALSRELQIRLLPRMEKVNVTVRQPLFEADAPIGYVYFPLSGAMSLTIALAGGDDRNRHRGKRRHARYAGVSRRRAAPCVRCARLRARCSRMRSEIFRHSIAEHPDLADMVRRYTHGMPRSMQDHRVQPGAQRPAAHVPLAADDARSRGRGRIPPDAGAARADARRAQAQRHGGAGVKSGADLLPARTHPRRRPRGARSRFLYLLREGAPGHRPPARDRLTREVDAALSRLRQLYRRDAVKRILRSRWIARGSPRSPAIPHRSRAAIGRWRAGSAGSFRRFAASRSRGRCLCALPRRSRQARRDSCRRSETAPRRPCIRRF